MTLADTQSPPGELIHTVISPEHFASSALNISGVISSSNHFSSAISPNSSNSWRVPPPSFEMFVNLQNLFIRCFLLSAGISASHIQRQHIAVDQIQVAALFGGYQIHIL